MHTQPRLLSKALRRIGYAARRRAVTFSELVEAIGPAGFGGAIMLLGVITALPTFGIPVATVVSLGILSLGAQLARGDTRILLPARLGRFAIDSRSGRKLLYRTSRVTAWIEQRTRERWTFLTQSAIYPVIGLIVLVMAFIILLPIPMGNLVPSIATVLIGAGLMAKDGLLVALGISTSGIAIGFTGFIVSGSLTLINWLV